MVFGKRITEAVRLLREGFGKYKIQVMILVVLGFLGGLLEVIGINAVIPLFSVATGQAAESEDRVSHAIRQFFAAAHLPLSLQFLMGFIIGMFILKSVAMILFNYVQIKITANYEQETRDELYRLTLGGRWLYLLEQKIGYLETVLLTDIGHITYLLRYISQAILLLTSLVMYTFVALNLSAAITLSSFVVGGILFLLLKRYIYRTRQVSTQFAKVTKQVSHFINEHVIGIKTVKASARETEVMAKARGYFDLLKNLRIRNFFLQNTTTELIRPIGMIFITVAFSIVYKQPGFNISTFAVIIYMIEKIFSYLQQAQMKLHSINEFIPYLKTVVEYKNTVKNESEQDSGTADFRFQKTLELREVRFSYGAAPVLDAVSFAVNKGGMTGLIGPSGAGKTTLVDILLRLFSQQTGRILLDGKNVQDIKLSAWREAVGYVSQDIFLLNDTIENNIRFYNPRLKQEEIMEAARLAHIDEFIQSQAKGLDTTVGERGVLLSGGQRQRIILARVLARKPQLLILDEATSALDNESEVAVQKAIDDLRGKTTVLVIAHRLSTVMNVDNLIVLEKGRIVEQGKPQSLLADSKSYFYKVYNIRENA